MFEGFHRQTVTTENVDINVLICGSGRPLLLLHGHPQTHAMWHKIAPHLAERFTVIVTDLRGYGDSGKPASDAEHVRYSQRVMAQDQVDVMSALGFDSFFVAQHDRGGRVAHRTALDHGDRVKELAILDIVPTHRISSTSDQSIATAYYHWFFLIQGNNLPETLIGHDPDYYHGSKLTHWGANPKAFTEPALAQYKLCFRDPASIHATCEDYRAAASIDLRHDESHLHDKILCPVLVLRGDKGFLEKRYHVLATWRERAADVRGRSLPCCHLLAEEAPQETLSKLVAFFATNADSA